MKKLIVASVVVLIVALLGATRTTAQTEPIDLGITDPVVETCAMVRDVVEMNGDHLKFCRLAKEPVVNGNSAIVTVRVATTQNKFILEMRLSKSIWQLSGVIQIG